MQKNLRKKFKKTIVEKALSPIAFVSYYVFGKKLNKLNLNIQKPDFINHKLAKNIKISQEPTEILFNQPFKIEKTYLTIQIYIDGYDEFYENHLKNPDKATKTFFYNPMLSDGTIINPKIQLIDEFQETHNLKFSWRAYCLGFTGNLPKDRKYVKLKISCDIPFESYLIRWFDITESQET